MLQKWILGDANAVEGITDFEIVFRIPCRAIYDRGLSRFYETEFKHSRTMFPDTSSVHFQLKENSVLWVMDGFDEATAEFKGFLQNIFKDLPIKHKVIITTRPSSCTQLLEVEGIREKQICEFALEKFDVNQIKEVAQNCEINVKRFENFYEHLEGEDKKFLETPLNLNLVLQLWSSGDNVSIKNLNTSKLFERLFEKQIKELVQRLKDRTNLEDDELEMSVREWFDEGLCQSAAMSLLHLSYDFQYFELKLDQFHVQELKYNAKNQHLIVHYCLSSFLDWEETSSGDKSYHFRHVIQKEALVSMLRACESKQLEYICCDVSLDGVVRILEKCNNYNSLLNLFTYVYEQINRDIHYNTLQWIEDEKRDLFDSLKKIIANSKNQINIRDINESQELKEVIELLLPEVTSFNCYLKINNWITLDNWSDVVNEYKDNVNFTLDYREDVYIYSSDDVRRMVEKVSKDLSNFKFKFFAVFLSIKVKGGDPDCLVKALIDLAEKCHSFTIELTVFFYECPEVDSNLLAQFGSKVKIQKLCLEIDSLNSFPLQLLNLVNVENLTLYATDEENVSVFEKLRGITQSNLRKADILIKGRHLNCLYTNLSQAITCKTAVHIDSSLKLNDVLGSERKKFKKICIRNCDDLTYNRLKKIASHISDTSPT